MARAAFRGVARARQRADGVGGRIKGCLKLHTVLHYGASDEARPGGGRKERRTVEWRHGNPLTPFSRELIAIV